MGQEQEEEKNREGKNMSKKMKECFGNPLSKEECNKCPDVIKCIMALYDRPLPSLILYSSDLTAKEEAEKK